MWWTNFNQIGTFFLFIGVKGAPTSKVILRPQIGTVSSLAEVGTFGRG